MGLPLGRGWRWGRRWARRRRRRSGWRSRTGRLDSVGSVGSVVGSEGSGSSVGSGAGSRSTVTVSPSARPLVGADRLDRVGLLVPGVVDRLGVDLEPELAQVVGDLVDVAADVVVGVEVDQLRCLARSRTGRASRWASARSTVVSDGVVAVASGVVVPVGEQRTMTTAAAISATQQEHERPGAAPLLVVRREVVLEGDRGRHRHRGRHREPAPRPAWRRSPGRAARRRRPTPSA